MIRHLSTTANPLAWHRPSLLRCTCLRFVGHGFSRDISLPKDVPSARRQFRRALDLDRNTIPPPKTKLAPTCTFVQGSSPRTFSVLRPALTILSIVVAFLREESGRLKQAPSRTNASRYLARIRGGAEGSRNSRFLAARHSSLITCHMSHVTCHRTSPPITAFVIHGPAIKSQVN